MGGYDRDLFADWYDADRDGCNTRKEVLIAESLDPVQIGSGCSISGGRWFSIYDNVETTDSSKFDIDHMVPLSEAWDSGAWNWNADQRKHFANDLDQPFFLIAVTASSNRSKAIVIPPNGCHLTPVTTAHTYASGLRSSALGTYQLIKQSMITWPIN